MPQFLTCPKGHRWEMADGASGGGALCPVCGSPLDSASPDSTVFNNPSWKPVSTAATAEPRPRLPDFEIVGELGRGGMGVVYKARQISRDRLVALNVIGRARLTHEAWVRLLRREAQAAARLSHPNVVVVYDYDHTGDTHYLVMEYVAGITLERLVERDGPLTVAHACEYVRQAALGLQHAQAQALVHRDIKPANLMVTWPGAKPGEPPPAGGMVKILDMGVARLYGQGGESLTTLTQGGVVIGTADFIAPEQLEDPHGADIRADLYSLGCTFYYLVTGRVPFPGGNLVQKLDRQRWETPPAVDQLRAEVPSAVVGIIRKLMAKTPAERYQTPGELVADLATLTRTGYIAAPAATLTVTETSRLTGHTDAVLGLALSPNGRHAVSAGKDGTLRLWDIASGKEARVFTQQPQAILAAAFSPRGDQVLSASGVTVRLWDMETGQEAARFVGHTNAVRCVAFSPDGRRALSGGDDKAVRVWELPSARETVRFLGHRGAVGSLAISRDRECVLSAGGHSVVRYWELHSGKELHAIAAPRGQIFQAVLTRGGHSVLSAHFDTFLRLWDLETGRELRRFHGHKQMVTSCAFTGDGRRILSGSQDHTLRLWDVDSGCEIACFTGHTAGVTCLALTGDGRFALSGSADKTIRLWQLPE